jgi:hypothetical protein
LDDAHITEKRNTPMKVKAPFTVHQFKGQPGVFHLFALGFGGVYRHEMMMKLIPVLKQVFSL